MIGTFWNIEQRAWNTACFKTAVFFASFILEGIGMQLLINHMYFSFVNKNTLFIPIVGGIKAVGLRVSYYINEPVAFNSGVAPVIDFKFFTIISNKSIFGSHPNKAILIRND